MRTILLVEDNPEDAELTRRALARSRIANEVVQAWDGAEALERLFGPGAEDAPLPALVMLDLKLPKVPGAEVLRRIRAEPRTRLLPVVVLTSSGEERDLAECYRHGCNSYVRKPVNFQEFADAVQHLGLYWLLLNQPPPGTGS